MLNTLPLVGRKPEREALSRLAAEAAGGRGRLILLGGEAGSGKSALLEWLTENCQPLAPMTGRCPGPDETPPYGPWLEIAQQAARRLGLDPGSLPAPFGLAPGEGGIRDLAAALAAWLTSAGASVLVALEDIHWADPASLELLRALPPRLTDHRILAAATYRSDEVSRHHPLWTLLPDLDRQGAVRIPLDRLSPADAAELVRAALPGTADPEDLARRLHARSGGHALFLRELLAATVQSGAVPDEQAPLPSTLQQAIDSRLARLSDGTQKVLEAAAVIGERFPYDLLASVTGAGEDHLLTALEQATSLSIVRPATAAGDLFAFDHALTREALVGRLIGPRLRRLHARVAEALLAEAAPDPDSVALHLDRAGDSRAADFLVAAGDRAARLGAEAQAALRYARAEELIPADGFRRGEVLLKLGRSYLRSNRTRALTYVQEAQRTAEAAGDRATAAWCRYELTCWPGRPVDEARLREAEAVEQEQELLLNDPRHRELQNSLYGGFDGYPRMALQRALWLNDAGRTDEARGLMEQILTRIPGGSLSANLLGLQWNIAYAEGRVADVWTLSSRERDERVRLNLFRGAAWSEGWLAGQRFFFYADDPDEVDAAHSRYMEREQELYKRSGAHVANFRVRMGRYQFYRGDWEAARRNLLAESDPEGLFGAVMASSMLLALGDLSGARASLDRESWLRPGEMADILDWWGPHFCALRVRFHLTAGETETARAWAAAGLAWVARRPKNPMRALAWLGQAELELFLGGSDAGWEAAQEALQAAEPVNLCFGVIEARRLLGRLAAGAGRPAEAEPHLRAALDLARRCRFPYEAALSQLALAEVLPTAAGAQDGLQQAAEAFRRLGAAPALAAAEAALTRLAETGAGPAPVLPDGLTEREAEVLRLVAAGLSDKEAAARLFISPRTVDNHLRNIFNKVNVSNRTALAAYAARHGLL